MSDSPRAVAQRLLAGITEARWSELADLYDEDTVVEQPFSPRPIVLRGRAEVAEHFVGAAEMPLRLSATNVVVHETTDPEVVVVEFDYDVETEARTATVHNIQVFRVRDGRIVASRDYHDHRAIAAVLAG